MLRGASSSTDAAHPPQAEMLGTGLCERPGACDNPLVWRLARLVPKTERKQSGERRVMDFRGGDKEQ